MELCGDKPTPMTGIAPKLRIIWQPRSFTAFSATKCGSKAPRNFTSIRSGSGSRSSERLRGGARRQQSSQAKLGMDQSRRALGFFFVDNNGNLNLRSRNHLNIDSGAPQAFKHSRRDA